MSLGANSFPVNCWLVIGQYFKDNGMQDGRPSVRVTKTRPICEPNEVAIYLSLDLPKSLFMRPSLTATISLGDQVTPTRIDAQVAKGISDAVMQSMGIRLDVRAAEGDT